MRKLALSTAVAFAFCLCMAAAQTSTPNGSTGAQGTQGSSPGMQQTQPGQTAPTEQPGMSQNPSSTDQSGSSTSMNKGEKKLKGCVQAQGGQYTLETKHGKDIALSGQDVSAHVGHEVEVKGTWGAGGSSSMSSTSSGNAGGSASASGSEKTFNVTDVKMISDSCKGTSSKGSTSGTGAGAAGGSSSTSGAGNSNGSSGTTPPQ